MIAPGGTIGILGAGQLGRMLGAAAAQLGFRTLVLAPDDEAVAAQTASSFIRADYQNRIVLDDFAAACDVITYEFENIALAAIDYLAEKALVYPPLAALAIAQDRASEKAFVATLGGRTAPWAAVETRADLDAAVAAIGAPAILKTRAMGYDGKGQQRIEAAADAARGWAEIGERPAILEGFVPFTHEFSIILARDAGGAMVSYPPPWNEHAGGVLARSTLPAPAAIARQWGEAAALAGRIAETLGYVGVLACEFFVGADGPVFNEMAPRVHNSGHWTIEGAITSQFENHIRAICGLPLGDTGLTARSITMDNLIGDQVDGWLAAIAAPDAHLHLYGKAPRPGRKMGHVTRLVR